MQTHPEPGCHVCGNTSYSWGKISAQSLHYEAEEASFWERVFNLGYTLPARLCNQCGNLQLFAASFVRDNLSASEDTACLHCGITIEAGQQACPRCGWTWRQQT